MLDDEGNIIDDITQIRLSDFVYRSLYHNYKLIYSKSRVQSIKNLGAKTLYQLALQWSNNGMTYARVDKLAEHIPMKDGISMVEKRKYIKRCLKKLSETDFMEIDINNKNIVMFKFKDLIDKNSDKNVDDMFLTYDEMLNGVMQLGYMKIEARRILDERITDLSSIQKALRQAYIMKKHDSELDEKSVFIQLCFETEYEQLTL